jgi:outer membrane protein assembly factor BamB
MARTRNTTRRAVLALTFLSALVALVATLGRVDDAQAWKNVPLKERHIEKMPYRPEWVTALKKGKFFKYKRKEYASPRIAGDLVFVGDDEGFFYAMKKKNGHKQWRFKPTGPVNSAPAFWNDRVIFGDDDGHLYALAIADGKEAWRSELDSEILSAPAVAGNRVFVETSEGTVVALNADDGKVLWKNERKEEFTGQLKMSIRGNSSPAIDPSGDRLYVGFSDGSIQALAASTGKVLWEKPLAKEKGEKGFEDVDGTPLVDGDRVFAATYGGGLYALSQKNGGVLWSSPQGSGVKPLLMGDVLVVSASNGHLYAYQKKDGTKLWDSPIGRGALTTPVAYQTLIAVGLSDSTMNFVDADDGHIIARRFAKKGIYSDPIVDEDRIYYLSNGGRVYSLRLIR